MSLLSVCPFGNVTLLYMYKYLNLFLEFARKEIFRHYPNLRIYQFLLDNLYVYMIICLINIFILGSGYYMYIEASSGSTGYKSDLVSKLLSPKHVLCMELWYNMYGSSMGSIDVYIKVNVQTIRKHAHAIYCDFSRL